MANKTNAALALQLGRLFNEMRYKIRRDMLGKLRNSNEDISFELLEVMSFLWHEDGMNQQELAGMVVKDKSSITYLVGNLIKMKWVKRVEDKTDRRNKLIFLTAKGKALQKKIHPLLMEGYKKAATGLNATEIKNAILLLKNMNENLKE
ncbi:MAG TPA: MarR family transcriptional regulator [Hanamia sp.]|nr:MarR family transcriptional regulator [Hanamia sp.]